MRIEWLAKKNTGCAILFFNGWGMDRNAVSHLKIEDDVVMCYDYRSWDLDLSELKRYRKKILIAWSMGVWAANRILPYTEICPDVSIALNGTARPVDDRYGIPVKAYDLTEKGMSERGQEKFFLRMFDRSEDRLKFSRQRPERDLQGVCEELSFIRRESVSVGGNLHWDRCYLSEKDMIFPAANQRSWCLSQKIPIYSLTGGHYPFYHFSSWKEIAQS